MARTRLVQFKYLILSSESNVLYMKLPYKCLFLHTAILSITQTSILAQKKVLTEKELLLKNEDMQWFRDAKFGMFIHWGLYSILGKGEWTMFNQRIDVDDYAKLTEQFDAKKFNANTWATIAEAAGMKYIVLVSKHHDGFALWDSKTSSNNFNSMYGNLLLNVGPNAAGEIEPEQVTRLQEMGTWLKLNGESIYATRSGLINYNENWGGTTQKNNIIYLCIMHLPTNGSLTIPYNGKPIKKSQLPSYKYTG